MEKCSVAISQFDGTGKVLKLEVATGRGEIVGSGEIPEEEISFGLFDTYGNNEVEDFTSLLATPEGPIIFFKNFQYRPEFGKTNICLRDGGGISHFLLLHEGIPIFRLFYKSKFGVGLHPYNKERNDIDFYCWLGMKVGDSNFYETYSKNLIFIK